jgi:hypothetical protein
MREHSGVDGMHGRRLGDLFECGPDRKAPALSSHCSSLTGKSAQADARVLCMRLRGSSELIGGQFSVALRYLLVGSQRSRFAMSIAARVDVPSGDSALVGNATQRPQNPLLRNQVLILEQKLPIHQSGHRCEQPGYLRAIHVGEW